MKTASLAHCSNCGVSYSDMLQGRIEYFIPWGLYLLCDKCHRLAVMGTLQSDLKPLFETPQWAPNKAIRE
jgi:hypothetical protein